MEAVANLPHLFQQDEIIESIKSGNSVAGEFDRHPVAIGLDTLLQKLLDRNFSILLRINSGEHVKLIEKLSRLSVRDFTHLPFNLFHGELGLWLMMSDVRLSEEYFHGTISSR